jgi:hypothetical protein
MLRKLCAVSAIALLPWATACGSGADTARTDGQKSLAANSQAPPNQAVNRADDKTGQLADGTAKPADRREARDAVEKPASSAEKPAERTGNPVSRLLSNEPEYRDVTLPAGTVLPVELQTTVASATSNVEDPVRATLRRAVNVDGVQALPAGSTLSGVVTDARRAARVKGRAHVAFRFNSVVARDERIDIRTGAIARTAPATKKKDAAKIGIGAGAGAVIGGIVGGGDGAAKGAVIGGAGGTGVVLATRGEEVTVPAGASLSVRLLEPITVRVPITR